MSFRAKAAMFGVMNVFMSVAMSVTADIKNGSVSARTLLMIVVGFIVGMVLSFIIPFGKISAMSCRAFGIDGNGIAGNLVGNIVPAFIICIIGNLLPIPFILWFITPVFNKLKKTKHLSKFVNKIEKKALSKKDKIEKAEFWGLFFFVGIPLPGTGGWTGSLIASLINMDKKKAMLSQPMRGKTNEEIIETRNRAIKALEAAGYEVVNTPFTDEWYSKEKMEERGVVQIPVCFLAKSI